jgi:nucleotide-binding universal stress UspA family protein
MFENVLVGVDGDWGGADAIALGARLLAPGAGLTLVHVRHGAPPGAHAARADGPERASAEAGGAAAPEPMLAKARAEAGVDAQLRTVDAASPGRGLHEQAERQGADLIVVGSSRHGLIGRAMLGDAVRGALNGAPCAVAVAARGYAEDPTPLAKIGVGYDGSAESRAALARAQELAAHTRASVQALEVVMLPGYVFAGLATPALGDTIETMVRDAEQQVQALPGVEGRATYGIAGEELARLGDEVDLLVVGSRNYGPLRRLVLGSTSEYLARHARCSLLVLPRLAG